MTAGVRWIGGRAFDLRWFMGSLLVPVIAYVLLVIVSDGDSVKSSAAAAIFYLLFTALFDAPHIFHTLARTHFDSVEWARHRSLQLLAFPLALAVSIAAALFGGGEFLLGFLYFYGSWHIARQNVGFLKLYQKLNEHLEPPRRYLDSWLAMSLLFYFFLHEDNGVRMTSALLGPAPNLLQFVQLASAFALLGLLVACVYKEARIWRASGNINSPKVLFMLGNAALFIWLTQIHVDFLTMTALTTIGHNIQYQAWIWLYHGSQGRGPIRRAQWLAACVAGGIFVILPYEKIGIHTGSVDVLGTVYAGCVLWHYFIDGRIWKFSAMPELREYFLRVKS